MERLTEVGLPPAVVEKMPAELSGGMGRGKEVNGAQTVLVNHKHWVDLVEASRDAEESV